MKNETAFSKAEGLFEGEKKLGKADNKGQKGRRRGHRGEEIECCHLQINNKLFAIFKNVLF